MWGEVTPAERLRSVTRRNVDDDRLAAEAADALAGFARRTGVARRRVPARARASPRRTAPLWWVCARILAAADPAAAAHAAVRELEADRTGDRLGATLPLLDEGEVVAVDRLARRRSTTRCSSASTSRRSRCGSRATIRSRALRRRRSDHAVRVVDPWDPALDRVARLLVPATAIGPERGARAGRAPPTCSTTIGAARGEVWLVGGVGRVLPGRLYDMAVAGRRPTADADVEEISMQRFDRLAGPRGRRAPGRRRGAHRLPGGPRAAAPARLTAGAAASACRARRRRRRPAVPSSRRAGRGRRTIRTWTAPFDAACGRATRVGGNSSSRPNVSVTKPGMISSIAPTSRIDAVDELVGRHAARVELRAQPAEHARSPRAWRARRRTSENRISRPIVLSTPIALADLHEHVDLDERQHDEHDGDQREHGSMVPIHPGDRAPRS